MARIKIDKKFLSIQELIQRWDCTKYDLQYIIEDGDIKVYVRPVAIEVACAPLFSYDILDELKHCPLSLTDIHRVFISPEKIIPVSHFGTKVIDTNVYVTFDDLIILTEDIQQYEEEHSNAFILLSADYRQFKLHGHILQMGVKQATVIKYLHERSRTDNPWVHGKELMKIAGSESWKIQNLFGHNKDWRIAVASDGHGYYKLNI